MTQTMSMDEWRKQFQDAFKETPKKKPRASQMATKRQQSPEKKARAAGAKKSANQWEQQIIYEAARRGLFLHKNEPTMAPSRQKDKYGKPLFYATGEGRPDFSALIDGRSYLFDAKNTIASGVSWSLPRHLRADSDGGHQARILSEHIRAGGISFVYIRRVRDALQGGEEFYVIPWPEDGHPFGEKKSMKWSEMEERGWQVVDHVQFSGRTLVAGSRCWLDVMAPQSQP